MKKLPKKHAPSAPRPAPGFPSAEDLLQTFTAQARPLRLDALLRVLDLARRDKRPLEEALTALAEAGRLLRLRGGLWTRPESLKNVTGRFSALRDGGGFVTPMRLGGEGESATQFSGGRDIYIPAVQTGEAWHQDLVRVALTPGGGRGPSAEGRIVEVLERGLKEVPAHVQHRTGRTVFCRPADSRLPAGFSVELPEDAPLPQQGALVLLAPYQRLASDLWAARMKGDYGREDSVAVQEELVKLNHQTPRDFPAGALAEAQALPAALTGQDMDGREDLRSLPFVTIDGEDARDFDDAVQVEARPGGWLLRVAIADVSHYVRPRGRGCSGALDAEALARGNSWYFPCSVEPMLPGILSNGLCSLLPHTDRPAVLAEIPFSAKGLPGKPRFALAVIRSAARLTYHEVKACLLDKDEAALTSLRQNPHGQKVLDMLGQAFALYTVLRAARRARGSLDFDLPEADSRTDAAGRVLWLGHRQRHDAHRLIEEFMIAANEAVARHLRDTGLPFFYRIHPQPDPERLESLFDTLAATGLPGLPPKADAASLQGILAAAHGTDQEFLVSRLCLRAMPQARYLPFNEGHFGLASQAYCHFTSPIRRYADLLTHRALKTSLGREAGPLPAGQKLLRISDQINQRERAAIACEREMDRRMACLALLPRVGQRFKGVVSGVTNFGLFVELTDMPVEGMIRLEDLGHDWYDLDPRTMSLVGQRSGVIWRMGQTLETSLAEVHLGRLEIRLMPLELPRAARQGKAPGKGGSARTGRVTGSRSGWKVVAPAPADRSARPRKGKGRSARDAARAGGRKGPGTSGRARGRKG